MKHDKTRTLIKTLLSVFKTIFPLDGEAPVSLDPGVSPNVFVYRLRTRGGGAYEGFVLLEPEGEPYLTPPVIGSSPSIIEGLNRKLYQIAIKNGISASIVNNGSFGRDWILFRPRSLAYTLRIFEVRQLYHNLDPESTALSDDIF